MFSNFFGKFLNGTLRRKIGREREKERFFREKHPGLRYFHESDVQSSDNFYSFKSFYILKGMSVFTRVGVLSKLLKSFLEWL